MTNPVVPPSDYTGAPVRPDHDHPVPLWSRMLVASVAIVMLLTGLSFVNALVDGKRTHLRVCTRCLKAGKVVKAA